MVIFSNIKMNKVKKKQMPRFMNTELKSDSSDSEAEPEYNTAN